jgi:hypothetical protein
MRWGSASDWATVVAVDGVPAISTAYSAGVKVRVPWMLATDDIRAIGREFLLGSHGEVDRMRKSYALLINNVHSKNTLSMRWLKWLGFIIDPTPAGPDGQFLTFTMGACNV